MFLVPDGPEECGISISVTVPGEWFKFKTIKISVDTSGLGLWGKNYYNSIEQIGHSLLRDSLVSCVSCGSGRGGNPDGLLKLTHFLHLPFNFLSGCAVSTTCSLEFPL